MVKLSKVRPTLRRVELLITLHLRATCTGYIICHARGMCLMMMMMMWDHTVLPATWHKWTQHNCL